MDGYDRESWETRWEQALRAHGDRLADRPPNAHLTAAAADLAPRRALDAGCGHGAETLWLAARGWRVTAVDFAATALARARADAQAMGPDVAGRVEWIAADLGAWEPAPGAYDLVLCLHVHSAGPVEGLVGRMAAGVAPGGTLLMTGRHPAPGQRQVSVAAARAVLDRDGWELAVAEDVPLPVADAGVDAVIRARRTA